MHLVSTRTSPAAWQRHTMPHRSLSLYSLRSAVYVRVYVCVMFCHSFHNFLTSHCVHAQRVHVFFYLWIFCAAAVCAPGRCFMSQRPTVSVPIFMHLCLAADTSLLLMFMYAWAWIMWDVISTYVRRRVVAPSRVCLCLSEPLTLHHGCDELFLEPLWFFVFLFFSRILRHYVYHLHHRD